MKYKNIEKGIFVCRPNRFVAEVDIGGKRHICHVKNTGRCRELLIEGVGVVLERADNASRKTEYDLIAVYKGSELINIDSQAPNKVFGEWIQEYFDGVTFVKPECKYKNSRFDFYIEANRRKIFVEVKGVTLEDNGVVMFPDAPTERGVKHIKELTDAVENGYEAYVFFIIQMEKCRYFTPNIATHAAFADALKYAATQGVNICAVNCKVSENSLVIDREVGIRL